ncbi:MAG: rhomboid family intramembrane serine protease [Nannocystaceae bacterium]|nr:rhomboid family intramembrane serine protease [Nannocystaceae bacterium]
MLPQIVLLAVALSGMAFARLLRRFDAAQRGYMLVVGAVFLLGAGAAVNADRFLGVVAVGLTVLVVIIPWVLELLARLAFNHGRLAVAVRMAGLRAMLMPGAGFGRQQEILSGLAILERDGVDKALSHFRGLADDAEDGGELAVINEQIVSMLFYGQRWDEGITHYERRFPPRYAAMRPALALGLLRAYGESGQLETAAGLLRALEEGPVGADPRAGGLLSQARLTFLAYAGAASPVSDALTGARRRVLGLSAASGALFRGIALSRAGQSERAAEALVAVEDLAGTSDDRVVDASRAALAELSGEDHGSPIELPAEMSRYAAVVAERLETFLCAAPTVRRQSTLVATPLLMGAMGLGYLVVLGLQRGGFGVLVAGAVTGELWHAGSWGRALVGGLVTVDPVGLLLNVYAIWLAGPLVERIFGPMRVIVTGLLSAAVGLALSAATASNPSAIVSGGSLIAFGITVGSLWTLLPSRTPGIAARTRRSIAIPLVLVGLAQVVSIKPGLLAADVSFAGLAAAALVGMVSVGLVPARGWAAKLVGSLAVPLVLLTVYGGYKVASEDVEAFVTARREGVELSGALVRLPLAFAPTPRRDVALIPVPLQAGWVDTIELRSGDLVQVFSAPAEEGRAEEGASGVTSARPSCALLRVHPELGHELTALPDATLPPAFEAAFDELSGEQSSGLRAWTLRRNGASLGVVIERTMGDGQDAPTLAILAVPAHALDHAPGLYAAILFDAVAIGVN